MKATTLRSYCAGALVLALCGGCFAPPAVLSADAVDLAEALKLYPSGTEALEIEVEPGVKLRGLFVPSQPNAPLVLHLLESSGSVASPKFHFGSVTRQLADIGYASLLIDYTGVGASEGKSSVVHLERDALAMWYEALRRVGGNAQRLYLRATSLGTIAAALVLKSGARPAAMVWIAPVLPDSATTRFARTFHGRPLSWAAALIYRGIADVDVVSVLKTAQIPGIILSSEEDPLLSADERDALGQAIRPAARLFRPGGGHLQLSLEAHEMLREEMQVFIPCCTPDAVRHRTTGVIAALPPEISARFAAGSSEREQLERVCAVQCGASPELVAAAALAIPRPAIAARRLWRLARMSYLGIDELDFTELCAVLSLDDPAGELPIDLIERASLPGDMSRAYGGMRRVHEALEIEGAALRGGVDADSVNWSNSAEFPGGQKVELRLSGHELFQALLDRGLSTADAERQFIRILLKAQRIPDRLVRDPEGRHHIEVKEKGEWTELTMDPAKARPATRKFELHLSSGDF